MGSMDIAVCEEIKEDESGRRGRVGVVGMFL